jgi:hypothetical protein
MCGGEIPLYYIAARIIIDIHLETTHPDASNSVQNCHHSFLRWSMRVLTPNRIRAVIFLFVTALPVHTFAQQAQQILTNADIVKMMKSGIADETIILVIQKTPNKFDTSPDALIELRKAGVSDAVIRAVLTGAPSGVLPQNTSSGVHQDCGQMLDKTLNAIGPRDTLNSVQSIRMLGQSTTQRATGTQTFQMERVADYSGSLYISVQLPTGMAAKTVLTPAFNYLTSGKITSTIPPDTLQELLLGLKMEPIYISQHREQYTCAFDGDAQIATSKATQIKVSGENGEAVWSVDPSSSHILRTSIKVGTSDETTDYSDGRQVGGIYFAFKRHFSKPGFATDITISEVQVNPVIDAHLFQPPANQPLQSLTFKVLQEESVPYVVETNGGISTSCNIGGSTNTTLTASTYGNTTYGNGTSTSNLLMNCNSRDTTVRWTHVLNAMLVQASDSNAYIIACDRAWRWSKCTPLRAGDTFLAERTDKGFLVQSINSKSKEQETIYSVLQSKSLK